MSLYKIFWRKSAIKDLRKIDKRFIEKIIKSRELLFSNVFLSQSKILKGSKRSYRMKVGSYRVIYQVNFEENTVLIIYIRHRKDVYKNP